jgi:hypothetical protein
MLSVLLLTCLLNAAPAEQAHLCCMLDLQAKF